MSMFSLQGGMKRQLEELCHILKYVDPVFYSYLDAKVVEEVYSVIPYCYSLRQITMTCVIFSFQESGNLYFCFRWLLIWFKREFSFPDTCSLWEALWTKM